MYVIHFVVDNQRIYLKDPIQQILVANTIGYLYCDFTFKNQEVWKPELEKKTSFSWGTKTETRTLFVENGQSNLIEIPYPIIQSPGFTVSVRGEAVFENNGEKDPVRITTSPFPIKITPSGTTTGDAPETEDYPEGIESPRQIAERALKEAIEAKVHSETATGNVGSLFEIIADIEDDVKKNSFLADSFLDYQLETNVVLANLKDKSESFYLELNNSKDKINGLINSLGILGGDLSGLINKSNNLQDSITELFDLSNRLNINDGQISNKIGEEIDKLSNKISGDLIGLRNDLSNYFFEEMEKIGLNLRVLLQGDYNSFTGSIGEKVSIIETLFSNFSYDKEFLGDKVTNLSTFINQTIDVIFRDFNVLSETFNITKEKLNETITNAVETLDEKINGAETLLGSIIDDVRSTLLGDIANTNSSLSATMASLLSTQLFLNETKKDLDATTASLDVTMKNLEDTIGNLNQTKKELEDSIENAQAQLEQTNQDLETATGKAKEDLETTKTALEKTIADAKQELADTQEDLNKTQENIETTRAELEAMINNAIQSLDKTINDMVGSAREELTNLINLQGEATQGSIKNVSDTVLGDLALPEITSVNFEDFEISQNSDDWGALSNFDNLGNWISNWLNGHNDDAFKYLLSVTFVHHTTVSLAQDVQRIRNNLGELAEDLSLAQEALYSTEEKNLGDIVRIGQSINTLQSSLKDESSARESQDNTLASAINENKSALSILQENEKNINASLLTVQVNLTDLSNKHNQFEEATIASFIEIKAYIDEQINSQIGAIINADY